MDTEPRERFERIEGRMDRVEANLVQISETMKEFSAGMKSLRRAQVRTNKALQTLLDALFTQRGNGHSKQGLPE